jgi:hypothetical protein
MKDTAEGARFEPFIEELVQLVYSAPDGSRLREKYQAVGHIAHGWLMRCVRGARAVLVLREAGYSGEASPLVRSVVEHAVALAWLVEEGPAILEPLKRAHSASTEKLLSDWRATGDPDLDENHLEAVLESVAEADNSLDNLVHFETRVVRYGTGGDAVTYRQEVMRSHATYQSAITYYDNDAHVALDEAKLPSDYRHFAAVFIFKGARAFNSVLADHPWSTRLEEIQRGLLANGAELEPLLFP